MGLRDKGKIEWGAFLILVLSLVFICFLTGGNPEAFLVDDNRMQWYPVMERVYDEFGDTGRICCYDLYQMKGMSIAKQGYYGVMNPFMLLSYVAAKLLPGNVPMISFYIGLLVVMGNLFFYLVCRRLGCGQKLAVLMTAVYSTAGCFWAFLYWYYIFNNYLIVPLLLYVFIRCRKGVLAYCACAVVLSMGLYMGNVQYTFYHYIVFIILCLVMAALKERRYFAVLGTNLAVGLGLSAPVLILMLQASGDFQRQQFFFENPIYIFSMLLHSMIPQGILHRWGHGFSFLDSVVMHRNDNMVLYMGATAILLCVFMIAVIGRGMKRIRDCRNLREVWKIWKRAYSRAAAWPQEQKMVTGIVVVLFFLLSVMGGGAAAKILYAMPVVRNFRYLFKVIFVLVPLAVMVLAWIVGNMEDKGRWKAVVLSLTAVFVCVGVFNAHDEVMAVDAAYEEQFIRGFSGEKEDALASVENAGMDCKNYRTVAFLRFPWINDENFNVSENLSRNFPTAVSVFSLAGYENSVSRQRMESFDAIYSDPEFYAKFANADTMQIFWQNLLQKPERAAQQLINNGVRYLLLDKTELEDNQQAQAYIDSNLHEDIRKEVITALKELPGIEVVRVIPFNEHYDLVEINGINGLCMDGEGNMVPLTDLNMQTVTFQAQTAGDYTLAFAYDRHLQAFLTEADGTKHLLSIECLENENILIPTQDKCGQVTLTYHNPVCNAGFVWEGMVSLAFVVLLAWLHVKKISITIEKTTEIC